MEQYRSGHNDADSKSVSLSRPVGSNPTCSAKQKALCLFRQRAFCLEGSLLRCFPRIRPVAMPLLLRRAISSGRHTTSSDSIVSQHQLMIALSGPVKSSQPSPFQQDSCHMISHVKSPTDHISRTFLIHGSIHTMHLPCGHTLPWRRSLRDGSRRYPLFRGSPSPYRQRCRLLSWHW